MFLTSPSFQNEGKIPSKFTCQGEGVNPELVWSGHPSRTQSFALIMDDPDASNGTFIHWMIWNIPKETTRIQEKLIPDRAIIGQNTSLTNKYLGPCPGTGNHRYFFRIYALDALLELPSNASRIDLDREINNHKVDSSELMGTYQKE